MVLGLVLGFRVTLARGVSRQDFWGGEIIGAEVFFGAPSRYCLQYEICPGRGFLDIGQGKQTFIYVVQCTDCSAAKNQTSDRCKHTYIYIYIHMYMIFSHQKLH